MLVLEFRLRVGFFWAFLFWNLFGAFGFFLSIFGISFNVSTALFLQIQHFFILFVITHIIIVLIERFKIFLVPEFLRLPGLLSSFRTIMSKAVGEKVGFELLHLEKFTFDDFFVSVSLPVIEVLHGASFFRVSSFFLWLFRFFFRTILKLFLRTKSWLSWT